MMGNYHGIVYSRMNPYMSGGFQITSWFQITVMILVLLDLALLAIWLWKQIKKK